MRAINMMVVTAVSLAFFMLAGCGSGASPVVLGVSYEASPLGDVLYYYNNTNRAVMVEVEGERAPAGVAKTAELLAPGDTYNPGAVQTGPLLVEGCSERVGESKVRVCWTAETFDRGQWLLAWMPYVLQRVSSVLGDPGEVDVIVAPPSANQYGGQFDNRDIAVVTVSLDPHDLRLWPVTMAVHELTHAAYLKLHGSAEPRWLNEAIASYAEGEFRYGDFDGGALSVKPTTAPGYARVQAAGFMLRELALEWSYETLRNAVATSDPVRTLTGLTLPEFSKKFWEKNKVRHPIAAPGRHIVPPYSLIATTSRMATSSPLELL